MINHIFISFPAVKLADIYLYVLRVAQKNENRITKNENHVYKSIELFRKGTEQLEIIICGRQTGGCKLY